MPEKLLTHVVNTEGGLNTQLSALILGKPTFNGYADELINFEPSKGYRRLSGHTQYGGNIPSGSAGPVLGTQVWNNLIVAAKMSGTAYDLWTQAPGNGTWTNITNAGYTNTNSNKVRFQTINFGTISLVWVDGANTAKLWNGTSVTNINGTGTPGAPSCVAWFQTHVCLGGDATNPSTVYISASGSATDFNGADNAVSFNLGDQIINMHAYRDTLYIFCAHSIWSVVGSSYANFTLQPVTLELGCTAPDSIQEIGGDVYFWSADGMRPIQASTNMGDINIASLTITIRPTIKYLLGYNNPNNIITCQVRDKSQVRIFFSNSNGTQTGARGILGGLNVGSNGPNVGLITLSSPRWEWAQIIGINPACAHSGYINGTEYTIHGGWDGNVYRQESGNDFNGTPIAAIYRTPYMDMTDVMIRKMITHINAYIKLEGACTAYFQPSFDYADGTIQQPNNSKLVLAYGNSIYDDPNSTYGGASTLWGAIPLPVVPIPAVGSCKTLAITVTSIDSQPSFSIQGFAIEHSMEGRA